MGRHLDGGKRAQVEVAVKCHASARGQRAHLAIPDVQQTAPRQAAAHAQDRGQVEWIIGTLTGEKVGGDGHAQGIQRGEHDFELGQVGAVVFTVTELKQAVCGDGPIAAAGGRVEADTRRVQVVDAQGSAGERALEGSPGGVIAEHVQQTGETVVSQILRAERLTRTGLQGEQALLSPRLHLIEAVVALGQQMRQPDGRHPACTQSLPIAMLMEVLLEQAGHVHAEEVREQQRKIIYSFGANRERLGHAESVRQSAQLGEI